jgi:hypothetical protein
MGVACGLGMLALTAIEARAGSLEILVTESGGPTIPILDGGAFDLDGATVGVITVNTTLLNGLLVNYQFLSSGLGATSNSPGTSAVGTLTQGGTVQLLLGGTGSITIVATDVDYSLPPAGPGILHSSASNTYTNSDPGNSQGFTSWYNPSNGLAATDVPSPTLTFLSTGAMPNSHSADAPTTPITLVNPYGLTNSTTITLTGGTTNNLSQAGWNASTSVTASPIPEPASMALLLTALPVTLFGAMRRRKAAE